jgi:hypothetical protein
MTNDTKGIDSAISQRDVSRHWVYLSMTLVLRGQPRESHEQ